ncbi:hypothetical protein EDD90_5465 [Streptomyces sp. Ag109_O5-1]|nr:hypothetical protein EDD90_5465 [Streptomyces sp. Ag109_O5-1]
MTGHGADLLIRVGAVHTLMPGQAPQRALAVRGDRIAAVSADLHGLDHLVTEKTEVHDLPGATVLPAFDDTHTHLILAGLGAHDVPVHRARNIPEFLDRGAGNCATSPHRPAPDPQASTAPPPPPPRPPSPTRPAPAPVPAPARVVGRRGRGPVRWCAPEACRGRRR